MIQNARQTGRNLEKKKLVWWSLILLKAEKEKVSYENAAEENHGIWMLSL